VGIIGPLTPTETKVAVMAQNGMKSFEIANQLHISMETVKTHRKNIRKKLGIQNSDLNLFTYLWLFPKLSKVETPQNQVNTGFGHYS
jgi:DNA-binding NarL/FixJ family response regulator